MPAFVPAWLATGEVLDWLRHQSGTLSPEETAQADRVCAMTEAYVQRCRPDLWTVTDAEPPVREYVPDAEVYQAAVMYAARELRRRNSPAGIELFADGGASFVAKFDADIERALRTGAWNRPGFG